MACVGLLGCVGNEPSAPMPASPTGQATTSHVSPDIHDVGEIMAGRPAEHRFVFRNSSGDTIRCDEKTGIRKSCGCTAARLTRTELPPNTETEILVSVSTGAKAGQFTERVTVDWQTAAGVLTREFALTGRVIQAFRAEPRDVTITREDLRQGRRVETRLFSDVPLDWSTLKLTPPDKGIRAESAPLPDGQGARLQVWVEGDLPGAMLRELKLSANSRAGHGEVLTGELPLSIEDSGLLRLATKSILLTRDATGAHYGGRVMLRGDSQTADTLRQSLRLSLARAATQADIIEQDQTPVTVGALQTIAQGLMRLEFQLHAADVPMTPGETWWLHLQHDGQKFGSCRLIFP
jgi:hypothetical protein